MRGDPPTDIPEQVQSTEKAEEWREGEKEQLNHVHFGQQIFVRGVVRCSNQIGTLSSGQTLVPIRGRDVIAHVAPDMWAYRKVRFVLPLGRITPVADICRGHRPYRPGASAN
jgi:hypothetical protein